MNRLISMLIAMSVIVPVNGAVRVLAEAVQIMGQVDTLAKEVSIAKPFAQQLYEYLAKGYYKVTDTKNASKENYTWQFDNKQGESALKELCHTILDHRTEYTDSKDTLQNSDIAFMEAITNDFHIHDAIRQHKPGWATDVSVEGREAECFFQWLRRVYYLNKVAAGHAELTKDIVPIFEYMCRADHDTLQQKWGKISGYYCCSSKDSSETWAQLSAGTIMFGTNISDAAGTDGVLHGFTESDASLAYGIYLGPTIDELEHIIEMARTNATGIVTVTIEREHMRLLVHVQYQGPKATPAAPAPAEQTAPSVQVSTGWSCSLL